MQLREGYRPVYGHVRGTCTQHLRQLLAAYPSQGLRLARIPYEPITRHNRPGVPVLHPIRVQGSVQRLYVGQFREGTHVLELLDKLRELTTLSVEQRMVEDLI